MDDFRLRVFLAAARTLSFTRAAEELFISQPAVSKHVSALETAYGVTLFNRRGSRLCLTAAGEVLLGCAERLEAEYRHLQYAMSRCTERLEGELRLGASTTVAQYLLPPILARFTARYPHLDVTLASGNSDQIEQALERGTVDLGIVESFSHRHGLFYDPFTEDELVLVARPDGAYGRLESVTPEQLCTLPLVMREGGSGTLEVTAAALARAGIRLRMLRIVMRLGSTEGIKAFVRNSDTLAIVSVIAVVDELQRGELRVIDLEGLSLRRSFSFVHPAAELPESVRRFTDFARASL